MQNLDCKQCNTSSASLSEENGLAELPFERVRCTTKAGRKRLKVFFPLRGKHQSHPLCVFTHIQYVAGGFDALQRPQSYHTTHTLVCQGCVCDKQLQDRGILKAYQTPLSKTAKLKSYILNLSYRIFCAFHKT